MKRHLVFISALIFALTFSVFAQTTQPTPPQNDAEDDEVIKIDSRLVVVPEIFLTYIELLPKLKFG